MKVLFFENNKKYIIRNDKVGNQYFLKNKKKIFLSAIPNKWKFITDGGYTPIESFISTTGITPYIFDSIISDRLKQIDRN